MGTAMTDFTATQLQVMWNRLLAIVEEQAQALIRTAFSPIVRECGDISAGIFDLRGRMLGPGRHRYTGHINTMAEAVKTLRDRFALQEMKPGDIYVTNDPWIASGHLNDFLLLMPASARPDRRLYVVHLAPGRCRRPGHGAGRRRYL